jgi:hypothetical protein
MNLQEGRSHQRSVVNVVAATAAKSLLRSPPPNTSHHNQPQNSEEARAGGWANSRARGHVLHQIWSRGRGPPHRTNAHRHIAAHATKVTTSKHRRPPPTARSTPPPPTKAGALDSWFLPRPRMAASSHRPPSQPARPRWRGREGGRPLSSQRRRPAPHPTAYFHGAARGAPSINPRRPRHQRCGIGRRTPPGTARGRGTTGEEVAVRDLGYRPPGRPRGGDPRSVSPALFSCWRS